MTAPKVSVVVPAYNAEQFIVRTIESVTTQSERDLEIIVVNDGSTDGSEALVRDLAARDKRIKLVSKGNGGVAEARNVGAALSVAPYIAFVDADDIWAADKIERQLACFAASDESVGLVYTWFARIDDDDVITGYDSSSIEEGDVLAQLCLRNVVGNGSAVMVRRDVFDAVGGFDAGLRALRAEGCEDYDFYARVAGRWRFALARDFLVGYRITEGNMSSDLVRMVRSRAICAARLIERHPQYVTSIRYGRRRYMRHALWRSLIGRRHGQAWRIVAMMLRADPFAHLLDMPLIVLRALQSNKLRDEAAPDRPVRFATGGDAAPGQPRGLSLFRRADKHRGRSR